MCDAAGTERSPRRLRRWWRRLALALAVLLVLLCLAVALLPQVVSSAWFKGVVLSEAEQILKRPVRLAVLRWTWSGGFDLEGLALAEDPEFSREPLLALDRLHAHIDLLALARKRLVFDVGVEGLRAQVIRSEAAETNVERLAAGSQGIGKLMELWFKLLRQVYRAVPVPAEVQGRLAVTGIGLQADDRERKHSLRIQDGRLSLDVPSLVNQPVVFSLSLDEVLDGKPLPPIRFTGRAERLVHAGELSLADALFDVEGRLPGGEVLVKGGLRAEGLQVALRLDLDALTDMAGPLLPASAPEVRGLVEFVLHVAGSPKDVSAFETVLGLKGVVAVGGSLGARRAGPIDLVFLQKGLLDMPRGVVSVESADLRLQRHCRIFWRGETSGIDTQRIRADAVVGPAHLDLAELLALARPFLPPGVAVELDPKAGDAALKLASADLTVVFEDGTGRAALDGLVLELPGLAVFAGGKRLNLERAEFRLDNATVDFSGWVPSRAELAAVCRAAAIRVKGPAAALVRGLDLRLGARVEGLAVAPQGLFGVQGGASFSLSGGVGEAGVAGKLRVAKLSFASQASCRLPDGPGATLVLDRALVESPSARLAGVGTRPLETGFRLAAEAKAVRLSGLKPLSFDVEGFSAGLTAGDWLKAELSAGLSNRGGGRIEAHGASQLDLRRALPLLAGFLPAKGRLAGLVDVGFSLAGRLPAPEDSVRLADANATLPARLKGLGFLESCEATLALADVEASLPLAGGGALRAAKVRTPEPLKVSVHGGASRIGLSGGLSVGRIDELPGLGRQAEPLKLDLSFSGGFDDLRELKLSQRLSLAPFNLNQTLSLSLDGLDQTLAAKGPLLAALLTHAQGTLAAKAAAKLDGVRQKGDKGLALNGGFEVGAEVRLKGGQEVAVRAVVDSPGCDLSLGTLVRLVNLQSHVEISRRYALSAEAGPQAFASPVPFPASLSAEVLRSPLEARVEDDSDLARRILDDLRGRRAKLPSLAFRTADLKAGPLDIRLVDHELALDLSKPLPSVDWFQVGLLGGSLTGSLAFVERPGGFGLTLRSAFTGIDANRLLPGKASKVPDDQAEVSGLFSLELPLTQDPEQLLGGLSLRAEISRIGPRTLERMLLALDPHEADETIVKQRRLLAMGFPRWIRLEIRRGSLSLAGEVEVKGLRLELPRIDRLNLANLPLKARLKPVLAGLGPVIEALKACSADRIVLSPGGEARLASSRARQ